MTVSNTPQDPLSLIQDRLVADLQATSAWFKAQMPEFYLASTPVSEQARHLELLHTVRRSLQGGIPAQPAVLEDPVAQAMLVIGVPGTHHLVDCLPLVASHVIRRVDLHTARDHSLFLYVFRWGSDPAPVDVSAQRDRFAKAFCGDDGQCSLRVRRFLEDVDPGYLARSSLERVTRHIKAWSRLATPEDVVVELERPGHGKPMRCLIATGAADPSRLLMHVGRILRRHGLGLARGYLDWVPAAQGEGQSLISSFYVHHDNNPPSERVAKEIAHDLESVLRPLPAALVPLYVNGAYPLAALEVLDALLAAAQQLIGPDLPYLDIHEAGYEALRAHPALGLELAQLVLARFQPGHPISVSTWERRQREVLALAHVAEPRSQAAVLEAMVLVASAVRLTNIHRAGRLGFAAKLDPALLPTSRFPHTPFGVLFLHGPHATGFHVRFRPSARGGLRLLLTRNPGQHARARDGLLREVYDLAWAQQLKNKDIPEGGAKCIALASVNATSHQADAAVRQVADGILDLIVPPESTPEIIGPHGAPRESALIFLGPDENMNPDRITWIANRAKQRGLPHAATLMSSKPGSGINHKEFGVTSEGLFTWITMALPVAGIREGQPYTLKITGGPDGDVGGNLLKILAREHRDRCRVIAISDGTGAAQDPRGLDWDELLRLVQEGQGIARFAAAHLSSNGSVKSATDKAGEQFRNDLHNTTQADLFVPCGGRPYTIDDSNWQRFIKPDGTPSARVMVEGANIFLSPNARRNLEDKGLIVIKDSSANKGGVICSSYEVLAGLVLSDDEFVAIKTRFVNDTLGLIRSAAGAEAKALIAAWRRRQRAVRLSELSANISEEINRVSGLLEPLISQHLDDPTLADTWRSHLEAHCPHILVEKYRERLTQRIPRPHRVAILAKRLASRMVYREGLTWCHTYVQEANLWELISTYLAAERQMTAVCLHLAGQQIPGGDALIRIIAAGAQRELVRRHLGQEDEEG